jgi:hypothetical protein
LLPPFSPELYFSDSNLVATMNNDHVHLTVNLTVRLHTCTYVLQ